MTEHEGQELISVILPVYNGEQLIRSSVSSVLTQTYKNLELIIIDDASDDNTHGICRELSQQDSRIKILANRSNRGVLGSRARAVDMAKGEWIAFIDADDQWQEEKLEKQIALRDSTGCDIVFTGSAFTNENGEPYEWIMHVPAEVDYKRLLKQNVISNSSVLVRKKDFVKHSPFGDPGRNMHEDFACWLSMLKSGLCACGIDEPLITYRVSKGSRAGNKFRAARMNLNTYKYIGLNFFSRLYYESCYMVNGLRKHRHFR